MAKNRRDFSVQEYRRKFCGMARHDERMERGCRTSALDDGMVQNAITLGLRERRIGHLVHPDGARSRLVDRERIRTQTPPPIGGCNGVAGALDLGERGQQLRWDRDRYTTATAADFAEVP